MGLAAQQAKESPLRNPGNPEATQAKKAEAPKTTLPAAQVPVAVRQAFQARFPTISLKEVGWRLKSDKTYEAEYLVKGAEVTDTPNGYEQDVGRNECALGGR